MDTPELTPAGFTTVVAAESARLLTVLRGADADRVVPSTPGWTADDLAWHVAEVQWFWGAIVADLLDDDGVEALTEPARPDDHAAVLRAVAGRSTELVAALERRAPDDVCWSWYEHGERVGWVARRQAHETLIHRVDAELAAGVPVAAPGAHLAADGIDELVGVMLDVPSWADFTPDGAVVRVATTDTGHTWDLAFGRATGTSPHGTALDVEAVRPTGPGRGTDAAPATVAGTAWDLDRWLWGRGPADPLRVTGDRALVHRLRAVAEVE